MNGKLLFGFALLALLAPLAFADSFHYFGESSKAACQCEQVQFSAVIKNSDSIAKEYSFEVSGYDPNTFSFFVTPRAEVGAKGEATITVFATPHCDAVPGSYSFVLISRQIGSPQKLLLEGQIQVKDCHYLALQVSPASSEVCSGDTAHYSISISNKGAFPEHGTISVDLNPSIASLSATTFNLNPQESRTLTLSINTKSTATRETIPFKVLAQSQFTYRSVSAVLNSNFCGGAVLAIGDGSERSVCGGIETLVPVSIENAGNVADEYDLSLSCDIPARLSSSKVSLDSGQSAQVSLIVNPPMSLVGRSVSCGIEAKSRKYGTIYRKGSTISIDQCFGASISSSGGTQSSSVCRGAIHSVLFTVSNTGQEGEFDISVEGAPATVSQTRVFIGEGESKTVTVTVDSGKLSVAQHQFKVVASNKFARAEFKYALNVENCFESQIQLVPNAFEMCPCDSNSVAVRIQNDGTREDEYSLKAGGDLKTSFDSSNLLVPARGYANAELLVSASCDKNPGDYDVTVSAVGAKTHSASLSVKVLDNSKCRGLSLEGISEADVEVCTGETFEVLVRNNGKFREVVSFKLSAPEWVTMTPSTLTIEPNSQAKLYIYFSPPFSAKKGEYELNLVANGQSVSVQKKFVVNVFGVGELGLQSKSGDYGIKIVSSSLALTRESNNRVKILVSNSGVKPITHAVFYFPQGFTIEQTPFNLEVGESKEVEIFVVPGRELLSSSSYPIRVASSETDASTSIAFTIIEPKLLVNIDESTAVQTSKGFEVLLKFRVRNADNKTVSFTPVVYGANYTPHTPSALLVGEEKSVEIRALAEDPKQVSLALATDSGVEQVVPIELKSESSPASGLFAGNTAQVGLLILCVVGALVLFAFYFRKSDAESSKSEKEMVSEAETDLKSELSEIKGTSGRRGRKGRKRK